VQDNEEQRWIQRAQAGDRDAFASLVERYWSRLYRWLQHLTRCTYTAEDLTQEVFLKVWGKLKLFQPGTNFRAWIFRVASNCLIDSRRRIRSPAQALPSTLGNHDPGPVAALLSQETHVLVEEALERLPLRFRAALLLRVQEGLSFHEIAQALALTEETARWRVFKARQILLKELGPVLDRGKA
jgi:RNA polymerase sigma-70 factor (ECF subfamily)